MDEYSLEHFIEHMLRKVENINANVGESMGWS